MHLGGQWPTVRGSNQVREVGRSPEEEGSRDYRDIQRRDGEKHPEHDVQDVTEGTLGAATHQQLLFSYPSN